MDTQRFSRLPADLSLAQTASEQTNADCQISEVFSEFALREQSECLMFNFIALK